MPLGEVLDDILPEMGVDFEIEESIIILTAHQKEDVLVESEDVLIESIVAQAIEIKGNIIDKNGDPLPGATILEVGTTNGTATDGDGNFSMTVASSKSVLKISFIGFITQTIEVGDKTEFNVVLEPSAASLEEVVVTGYQTISRERATGSFTTVSKEVLEQTKSLNILERLESVAAGIYIDRDPETGALTPIIRGTSSMQGDMNYPLVVVDGFPLSASLESINPDDVESVTILKDASAASIWGAQASNGVIIITTKAGRVNQDFQVTVSASTTIENNLNLTDARSLSSTDYVDLQMELADKNWFGQINMLQDQRALIPISEAMVLRNGWGENIWGEAQFQTYINDLRTNDIYKQIEDNLLRQSLRSIYNISVSGGSDKNSFYGSIVYNDILSRSIGTSNNRIVLNLTDTYKFNNKLSVTVGMNTSLSRYQNNGLNLISEAFNIPPFLNMIDDNGNRLNHYSLARASYNGNNNWTQDEREAITGINTDYNFIDEVAARDNNSESADVRIRFSIDYKILKGLKFNSKFQYEMNNSRTDNFRTMDSYYMRNLVSKTQVEGQPQVPVGINWNYSDGSGFAYNFRNTLTYDKDWDQHKLTLFAGTEMSRNYNENLGDAVYGYNKQTTRNEILDGDYYTGNAKDWQGKPIYGIGSFYSGNRDIRAFSMFSNLGYEYNGKYTFNASFRIDQKNLFGSDPKYRYKPLWSVGFGWNMKKEGFLQNVDFVNRLRLRATYGVLGNSSNTMSPYANASNSSASHGGYYIDYLSITNPANPQLRWEEASITNVAVDFALFNNRISGSLEYYSKSTTDLIGRKFIDPTNGWGSAYLNYASMNNSGIELVLNSTIVNTREFKWNATLNLSYNRNIVTALDNLQDSDYLKIRNNDNQEIGQPLSNLMSYNYAGLNEFGWPLAYDLEGIPQLYSNPYVNNREVIKHGPTIAPYYGSINTTARYKDFDLTLNLTYKFGHVFRTSASGPLQAYWGGSLDNMLADRWREPGDELNTRVPGIAFHEMVNPYTGNWDSMGNSTWRNSLYWTYGQDFVHNAGVIRLRDVILGYNLPRLMCDKVKVKSVRLTVQLTNPLNWYANDKGLDPADSYFTFAMRYQSSVTFGIKATF